MRSQIPSMYKMESDKEQFLPLCYSVYTLTKLSSYYAVQWLDAKSRVSIWASGYMQMILFCFLLAEQVFMKWWKGNEFLSQTLFLLSTYFATRCRRHLIFQDINSFKSNSISLKYQRFTLLDWKDIGIRKV